MKLAEDTKSGENVGYPILFGTTIAHFQRHPMAESGKSVCGELIALSLPKQQG
jgi:hypothetical protein